MKKFETAIAGVIVTGVTAVIIAVCVKFIIWLF